MKRLGELLVDDGLVSREDLDRALNRQSSSGGRLGTNLVEMMLIDDVVLGEALSRQLDVPFVHPRELESISADVLEILTVPLVELFKAVPFKWEGQRLHCAMLDPSDIQAVDNLSHRLGCAVKPYACAESILYRAMSVHYQIQPPARRSVEANSIVHGNVLPSNSGLISLDDEGQFTLVDRGDILGSRTKTMFMDAATKTAVVGYFLQFLSYITDKIAFLAYDRKKNYLWRDAKVFQEGRQGIACGETVNRSKFWQKYLDKPAFVFIRLPQPGNEMNWVVPLLDMPDVKSIFLAPLTISKRVTGVVIGGSSSVTRMEEELETIRKLYLIATSTLKIQELRKLIENVL
ncbi:hypothetical protein JXA40_06800 [bacterium]|nr:hypothetical protein [candidate division CSSED10-310 bacterium]